jgi:radical SAM-linked protein
MTESCPDRPTGATAVAVTRHRVAIRYAMRDDLRYLSHHDEMRMLSRALVRAGWPLRFSQGFNPTPHLSIPLPRSVGMASECQWALVEMREPGCPQSLYDNLAAVLPRGCVLQRIIAPVAPGTPHAAQVEYAVELDPPDVPGVAPRLGRFMDLEQVVVRRDLGRGRPARVLDIRPPIEELSLDGPVLRMRLRCLEQGTVRPYEILTELGLAADAYSNRVCRTEVRLDLELAEPGDGLGAPRGLNLGTTEETTNYQEEQDCG